MNVNCLLPGVSKVLPLSQCGPHSNSICPQVPVIKSKTRGPQNSLRTVCMISWLWLNYFMSCCCSLIFRALRRQQIYLIKKKKLFVLFYCLQNLHSEVYGERIKKNMENVFECRFYIDKKFCSFHFHFFLLLVVKSEIYRNLSKMVFR